MKKIISTSRFVVGVCLGIIVFSGCLDDDNNVGNDGITGSGKLVSQMRNTGPFTGIQVTGAARVFITQDSLESLRVEADDNIIDFVTTSVTGNTVFIHLKDGSYNHITVNVYASMKEITQLESRGAAEISTVHPIVTDTILCKIRGAGAMTLSGVAVYESAEIVGAGAIKNFHLQAERCMASISGTGEIEVNVTQQLDAEISGTGTITYDGNPPVVHPSISGVGRIEPKP